MKDFTNEDEVVIYELARIALADAETYEAVADSLDLSDGYLKGLQARLELKLQEQDFFI